MPFSYSSDRRPIDCVHMPFGKYIDQPVTLLRYDVPYARWLLGTDWFAIRYAAIAHIVADIVAEEEYRSEKAKKERLAMTRQRAAEAELLVNAKAGPALCVVFASLQQHLDEETMCSEYRNNWIEELFKLAGRINDDAKLGRAFAAVEAKGLVNIKLRDFEALMLQQVMAQTEPEETGTVVSFKRGNKVVSFKTARKPLARPRPPAA